MTRLSLMALAMAGCLMVWSTGGCSKKQAGGPPAGDQASQSKEGVPADNVPGAAGEAGGAGAQEVKTPIVAALLKTLEELPDEGTADEHALIRQVLLESDEELSKSLGASAHRKILHANKSRPAPKVRPHRRRHTKRRRPDQHDRERRPAINSGKSESSAETDDGTRQVDGKDKPA